MPNKNRRLPNKQSRDLEKVKKAEALTKALKLCEKYNSTAVFHKDAQDQRVVKAIQQISISKVVKGKSRDVRNCPILLKEPGLPKEIAEQNVRNFEPRVKEQDLVLY